MGCTTSKPAVAEPKPGEKVTPQGESPQKIIVDLSGENAEVNPVESFAKGEEAVVANIESLRKTDVGKNLEIGVNEFKNDKGEYFFEKNKEEAADGDTSEEEDEPMNVEEKLNTLDKMFNSSMEKELNQTPQSHIPLSDTTFHPSYSKFVTCMDVLALLNTMKTMKERGKLELQDLAGSNKRDFIFKTSFVIEYQSIDFELILHRSGIFDLTFSTEHGSHFSNLFHFGFYFPTEDGFNLQCVMKKYTLNSPMIKNRTQMEIKNIKAYPGFHVSKTEDKAKIILSEFQNPIKEMGEFEALFQQEKEEYKWVERYSKPEADPTEFQGTAVEVFSVMKNFKVLDAMMDNPNFIGENLPPNSLFEMIRVLILNDETEILAKISKKPNTINILGKEMLEKALEMASMKFPPEIDTVKMLIQSQNFEIANSIKLFVQSGSKELFDILLGHDQFNQEGHMETVLRYICQFWDDEAKREDFTSVYRQYIEKIEDEAKINELLGLCCGKTSPLSVPKPKFVELILQHSLAKVNSIKLFEGPIELKSSVVVKLLIEKLPQADPLLGDLASMLKPHNSDFKDILQHEKLQKFQ